MSLFFIKMLVNPLNLIKLSAKHGHFSAAHQTMNIDQGYLVHRLLSSLFDQNVPKSFFHQVNHQHYAIEILFYHERSLNELLARVEQKIALQMITHDPNLEQLQIAQSCVMLKESEDKDLSNVEWGNLGKIAVSTLIVPISRITNAQNKIKEIDAYLLYRFGTPETNDSAEQSDEQAEQSNEQAEESDEQSDDPQPEEQQSTQIRKDKSRYEVYEDWFKKYIDQKEICSCDVAKVSSFKMDSFERKNLREDGKKNWKALKRPVIEIKSILTIRKPEEIPNLLLKGIGRHQAFGFGMLKIIPTSSV